MKRRTVILSAAAAAAVGAGLAWQRWQEQAAQAADAATGGIWQARFEQPGGGTLDMAKLRGTPLVLNFWGTWCPPCVKEMPELDQFQRQFGPQGWRVVGLAVDNPSAVQAFLARSPVTYTIGLAGFEGSELSRKLGNAQGGLPFTVLFNRRGDVAQRKSGQTSLQELANWAKAM
jgi:thiol-disulfide isomerase/thioredoxin